jgi:hypothetical protein
LRRTPIWIAFGEPIQSRDGLPKSAARHKIEAEFGTALGDLSRELCKTFSLTENDLPQSPRQRMRE